MILKARKGFTLIELLVVIAIIGLLSTLAVVALNSARQKGRDASRLTTMKQLQTALELYFNDRNAYPIQTANLVLGGSSSNCLGSGAAGFAGTGCPDAYMPSVPAAPTPPTTNAYTYAISDGSTYKIYFTTEATPQGLPICSGTAPAGVGQYKLTPSGILCRLSTDT